MGCIQSKSESIRSEIIEIERFCENNKECENNKKYENNKNVKSKNSIFVN